MLPRPAWRQKRYGTVKKNTGDLIETTSTGYVIVDPQGKVLDANPEYVRLSGHYRIEEICGTECR